MAIYQILTLPHPTLRRVAEPVTKVGDEVRALLEDMLETMYAAPGIGLAAVQIGIARRIAVVDCAPKGSTKDPLCMVNPQIIWQSEELSEYEERCLSIPEIFENVERPNICRVKYLDKNGEECERDCEELLATCVQHEIDHLNGVLFIDHISRLKRDRIIRKFNKAAKERKRADGAA